jgi:hypothetical protein
VRIAIVAPATLLFIFAMLRATGTRTLTKVRGAGRRAAQRERGRRGETRPGTRAPCAGDPGERSRRARGRRARAPGVPN